ncbi:crotonyl-CoA carboxylase/reductase [Pseudonocardia kujensis]|uniref:crotonyl-CoA carboxylase/reductase n=1 Tax=Pseudonocardia kujensis TaxID=1128675 RepID=UPI001E362FF8|nr:crotonyl-CoA carboxylase/reductase [Pseudonocardia kujensis]MCE0763757.1 crotonyl-CoA carboxylase/reductase [Pseudonocardia kujensis]
MADIVPIGSLPAPGDVPARMHAQVVRTERLGEPRDAFRSEEIEVPRPGPGEVLVAVMAAGVNFNNVWAARGIPINVIADRQRQGEPHDFHIGGSDASGIVWALGEGVDTTAVGEHVVVHPGYWDPADPEAALGRDPMLGTTARIWGYNTNFGSFAQFCLVQAHQILPKADILTWAEAAAPTLVGTTAYRMLHGWAGHTVERDDVVLVWGGSGGVGSQAIQLAREAGALPVAVVSGAEKGAYCEKLGAVGWIDRRRFDHWGQPPHWTDVEGQKRWTAGARAFGKAIWDAVGSRRNPRIVIEHPGEDTIPTSGFVCDSGGMVVICAGTTGYSAAVDLRHHWVKQKRLQGSHGTNDAQAIAYNQLVRAGRIDPCVGEVRAFDQVGAAHQDMHEGRLAHGNTVVLVGATSADEGATR